jgi:hypothetical protein
MEHHEAVVDAIEADLLTHVADDQARVGLQVARVTNRDEEVVQPVANQFASFVILEKQFLQALTISVRQEIRT